MKFRITLAAATLAMTASAHAQTVVSVDTGESAHACYAAAKTGIEPKSGIADCNAALTSGLSAENRAATLDNRGFLFDRVKDYVSAWSDFNASICVNPELGDPYLNRGVALIRLTRLDEAVVDINKGITLGVSLPQIGYYDLAVAEELMGRVTDAYHDYKRALVSDPEYAPATEALKRFKVTTTPAPANSGPAAGKSL